MTNFFSIKAALRRGLGRYLTLGGLLAAAPLASLAQTGGVGIGTTTPNASAALDVSSTSKGLLPPRLSQAQRDAIASPAAGLTIYNTTTNKVNTWNGTSWDAALSATEQAVPNPAVTFAYTGAVQTYTVPAGVTSLLVDAKGASGGNETGYFANNVGGAGARVQATLRVVPGQVLQVLVGGAGTWTRTGSIVAGGYNGGGEAAYGGSGGGATDIRNSSGALADRLLVAAGGGGGGDQANGSQGGAGGALTGGNGTNGGTSSGTGGTQTAGGSTGGTLGTGGSGNNIGPGNTSGGGGGGGGYYGGGGNNSLGGGGGGASWMTPTGSTGIAYSAGANTGNGSLTITPNAIYAAPVLDGSNFVNVPWTKTGSQVYPTDLTNAVGIGTATPDASAALEVSSTSKGLLPPRLSQAQRDAIASPATGLTIYNTTAGKLNTWNGSAWEVGLSATEQPYQGPTVTFGYTGGVQPYTVPAGVTSLLVDAKGASGGTGYSANTFGGAGARVQAMLRVVPGQVLQVRVGGAGGFNSTSTGTPGGYNGGGAVTLGGAGGGATDVRSSGGALTDRLLVAGGGGGGGYQSGSPGGAGGAPTGGNGAGTFGTSGGMGGTQTAGGNAGGTLGTGGNGSGFANGSNGGSGGGGGGYYGGGGNYNPYGGGGGGSSWVTPTGSTGIAYSAGANTGDGSLTITPNAIYAAPVLDGSNFVNVPGDNLGNHTATQNLNLGTNLLVGTTAVSVGNNLNLGTNQLVGNSGSQGLAISSTGNVGIGTTTPSQKLDVAGNANMSGNATVGGSAAVSGNATVGGNVGIGTTTPSQKLDVAGSAAVSGNATVGGNVGIGTSTPDASAALDVSSTTKGLLPPRLTQAQRDAIASPAAGLTVYNTTTGKLNTWNGTNWDAALSTTEQSVQNPAVTFSYTGAMQTYTVPAGVISLSVEAKGASGGSEPASSGGGSVNNTGGLGARVQATLSVTPGQVLQVRVGGAGIYTGSGSAGGYNGGGATTAGGAGGGATDLRGPGGKLPDRLLVAAGGGGGGYNAGGSQGGAGGAPNGVDGASNNGVGGPPIVSATGGTQTAGGSAGGSLGQGGATNSGTCCGGGGGGGYYGGGGGRFGTGGGGSSFVTPAGSSAITYTAGANYGDGGLTITPSPAYAAPVLNGANFVNVPGTWQENGADVYRSTGNVGIGTATPSQKLMVAGGIAATASELVRAQGAYLQWNRSNNDGETWLLNQRGLGSGGIRFGTSDAVSSGTNSITEWVRFDYNGNVGIGTTTPGQKLEVAGNTSVSGNSTIGGNTSVSGNSTIGGNVGIGIGTSSPAARLQVNGTALVGGGGPLPSTTNATGLGWNSIYVGSGESEFYNYRGAGNGGFRFFCVPGTGTPTASNAVAQISNTGVYTSLSDRRVKTNIIPLAQGLRTVLALRPVSYDFHTSRRLENGVVTFLPDDKPVRALGFVAQELLPLVPEAVEKPDDERQGFYTVSYATLVPVLTQAIQEQQAQIEELKKQNAALKADAGAAATQAAADHASLLTLQAQMARLLGEAPQASLAPRK